MSRWSQRGDVPRGDDYDSRWRRMEAAGEAIHGEVDLVEALLADAGRRGDSVLDAGCGTGRVAIELARRGFDAVGVDLDPDMLDSARSKGPHLTWLEADVATVTVPGAVRDGAARLFGAVVLAGNVMIFVEAGSEPTVIANMARHLSPGGFLIAGFQLQANRLGLSSYDEHCRRSGLELAHRWSTWDRQPFDPESGYAVSVHTRRE